MRSRPLRVGGLQALEPIIEHTLHRCGLSAVWLLWRIVRVWQDIAGPQIAVVAQPESIRGQMLFITVRDAIWLQQVTFYQAQLLGNIRRELGDVPIARLHFTLAASRRRLQSRPTAANADTPSFVPLTAEEKQQVGAGVTTIADPDLREAVRRAWERGWQVRRPGI